MQNLTEIFLIGIGVTLFFGIKIIQKVYNYWIIQKDIKYRQKDNELAKYYTEMVTDRNDGWTKLHYKKLYKHRLEYLKSQK